MTATLQDTNASMTVNGQGTSSGQARTVTLNGAGIQHTHHDYRDSAKWRFENVLGGGTSGSPGGDNAAAEPDRVSGYLLPSI